MATKAAKNLKKANEKLTDLANEYYSKMSAFCNTKPSKSQIELHHESLEERLVYEFENNVRISGISKDEFKQSLISQLCSLKEFFLTKIDTAPPQSPDITNHVFGKISYNRAEILGTGSKGTKVYKGTFGGREIAVKRLDFEHTDMKKVLNEIDGLIMCDSHENVVRYFGKEHQGDDFILLALEICYHTLEKWIEENGNSVNITISRLNILEQTTEGLKHLHCQKIVHRDIKPQNILLRVDSRSKKILVKISDFGICKILPEGRSYQTMTSGLGSEGWMAPEILRFLEERRESGAIETLTYAADIFSLGCVFYYVLTWGEHPFWPTIRRNNSILDTNGNFDQLETQYKGLKWLLHSMTSKKIEKRPPASEILQHHIFWSDEKSINFIVDVSNEAHTKSGRYVKCITVLEQRIKLFHGNFPTWLPHLCDEMNSYLKNLPPKYGKYKGETVMELIRLFRNMHNHKSEDTTPPEIKKILGTSPSAFIDYWVSKFPFLVPVTWLAFHSLKKLPEYGLGHYYPGTFQFEFGSFKK